MSIGLRTVESYSRQILEQALARTALALTSLAALGCHTERSPKPSVEPIAVRAPSSSTAQVQAAPAAEPTAEQPANEGKPMTSDASIGSATMEADGTIVLQLRAEGPGMRGDALLRYPKGHKEYHNVLKHLGGLRPGESKAVPPWPEEAADTK